MNRSLGKCSYSTFTVLVLLSLGCWKGNEVITRPPATLRPTPLPEPEREEPAEEAPSLKQEELEKTRRQIEVLEASLEAQASELVALEERYKALEIELAGTMEEVLRAKASTRGFQNRAFATLRIAEVRVQIETFSRSKNDPEVDDRLRRADELLTRADRALEEENYSGAAFLAERAGELVHQANLIQEYRLNVSSLLEKAVPIVPERRLEARVNCNLREGPSLDARRVGGLLQGQQVDAVARLGDWYQVKTDTGRLVWLHQSVVH
jgi:uncharacterized protein YgiM (DUF1202 family)